MTNEQILKQAIRKAVENGYIEKRWEDKQNGWVDYNIWLCKIGLSIPIIFSQEFAKSFWGKEKIEWRDYKDETIALRKWEYCEWEVIDVPAWQYHLQQLVLEEEPLKYIEKFL